MDVEAWSPRQQKYFEVGSCSNLGDAQARRLGIKIKDDKCGSEEGGRGGVCSFNSSHRLETDEIAPFNDNTWSA